MTFKQFADAVNTKFTQMQQGNLFVANVAKETLWETYQAAYPAEDNPIFRERRVHECNTCYSFIKRIGHVVSANPDGTLDTIWNIPNLVAPYDAVAQALHNLVSSSAISSVFLSDERLAGREFNIEANEAGDIKWEHFYAGIDNKFITKNLATELGNVTTTVSVFKRALEEFSESSLTTVIDLCSTIYKGEEFKPIVVKFLAAKQAYTANPTNFVWLNYSKYPARIRNSAIGTLIIDIEAGIDIEEAVRKYEAVVAPSNYKRTTAVVTPSMKKLAMKTITDLGIEDSLYRRHATITDISVNNVLFADRSSAKLMKGTLANLLSADNVVSTPPKSAEISIDKFLAEVLPTATSIEALVENRLTPNFVSLVAPVNPESPNILKWNNNFTWSYNGEVTDSMKERVKSAGGKVDGVLRFSIQWNEDGNNRSDLDAHCYEPDNNHIYFMSKHSKTLGNLDVDIRNPYEKVAVENITWPDKSKMLKGKYLFYVHNYSANNPNKSGFTAQIEFDGQILDFSYNTPLKQDQEVAVAEVYFDGVNFKVTSRIPFTQTQRTQWDITTLQYQKVSTIMLSPNFWDEQTIGNKHFFFMLDGCNNPSEVRGFYNEFLSNELTSHRKVFEMLSEAIKCAPSNEQLSGLGFSSTVRNNLHVRVDGRPYQIKF